MILCLDKYVMESDVSPDTCTVTIEDTDHEKMIFNCGGGKVYQIKINVKDEAPVEQKNIS